MMLLGVLGLLNCLLVGGDSVNFVVPEVELIPGPIEYYTGEDLKVGCSAWPPDASVALYAAPEGSVGGSRPAALQPLPRDYTSKQSAALLVTSKHQLRALKGLELHCLAKTSFGTVLGRRPFTVKEAKIADFPPASSQWPAVRVQEAMQGNVAQVDCLPPRSDPPAEVKFEFNGTAVGNLAKYKYVFWPDGKRVSLLIHPFVPQDQGNYRCVATNPKTMQRKISPSVTQLKIKTPRRQQPVRLVQELTGRPAHLPRGPQTVVVREGSTVTLFCLMEGAPPPRVTTYSFNRDDGRGNTSLRFKTDPDFGTLTIKDVQAADAGPFVCSDNTMSSTATLIVKKRLRITQAPQDIRVSSLGVKARFTCSTSDPQVTPQWYFNGQRAPSNTGDGSLYIRRVDQAQLGVYQCVARRGEEWVTRSATLSLRSDVIIVKPEPPQTKTGVLEKDKRSTRRDERKRGRKGKRKRPRNEGKIETRLALRQSDPPSEAANDYLLAPPRVIPVFDNLAVRVQWQYRGTAPVMYYRLQYQSRGPMLTWGTVMTLDDQIKTSVFYMAEPKIEPGLVYRFRIHAVTMETGHSAYSRWSPAVSFENVQKMAPMIHKITPAGAGRIRVLWVYSHAAVFPVDRFMILCRREEKREGGRRVYSGYTNTTVEGGNSQEFVVSHLRPDTNYQVILYGIQSRGGQRRITKFSDEVHTFVPPVTEPDKVLPPPAGAKASLEEDANVKNNAESNKLMFIILGALAGLMLVVMLVLVGLCLFRQRPSSSSMYKDPAMMIHRDTKRSPNQPPTSFQMANMNANMNHHQAAANQSLLRHGSQQPMEGAALMAEHNQMRQYQQQHGAYPHQLQSPGYYGNGTLKREPPSGGSVHDNSDDELAYARRGAAFVSPRNGSYIGGSSGMIHCSSPPPQVIMGSQQQLAYMQALQRQHQLSQQQLYQGHPHQSPPSHPVHPYGGYVGQGVLPAPLPMGLTPSQMDVNAGAANDGDSVYSYFSQRDTYTQHDPYGQHPPSWNNTTGGSYGNAQGPYTEAGSQTATGGGPHRHHRRRRRKPPQHNHHALGQVGEGQVLATDQQQQQQQQLDQAATSHMKDMATSTAEEGMNTEAAPGFQEHHPQLMPDQQHPHPDNMAMTQRPPSYSEYVTEHPDREQNGGHPTRLPQQPSGQEVGHAEPGRNGHSRGGHRPPQPQQHEMEQQQQHGYRPYDDHAAYAEQARAYAYHPGYARPGHDPMYDQPGESYPSLPNQRPALSNRNLLPGAADSSTLTRRGTPTLFVEPPRVRDYSEYGIPNARPSTNPPTSGGSVSANSDTSTPPPPQRFTGGYGGDPEA